MWVTEDIKLPLWQLESYRSNAFVFTTDENGEEYVALSHDTKQKNWQDGTDNSDSLKGKQMYAIPDWGEKCPVKFLSKTDKPI